MLRVEKVDGRHVVSDNEIEIKTAPGKIYVSTTKHVGIKVFTILGSVVSETTLSPGKHSFDVPAHGVYIIKAGDITCKVAV